MIICDLDGTISDDRWRRFLLPKSGNMEDYDLYHSFLENDMPFYNVLEFVVPYEDDICIMTARPAKYTEVSKNWLEKHGLCCKFLQFRGNADNRPAWQVKQTMVIELLQQGHHIDMVLEDRMENISMFKKFGLITLQTRDGRSVVHAV